MSESTFLSEWILCLSFFPRDVLDEILNLIESVSEDFPSYSFMALKHRWTKRIDIECDKVDKEKMSSDGK